MIKRKSKDSSPKYVVQQHGDSAFAEVFDAKTGFRIETTGNEDQLVTEVESEILRDQQKVIMENATNYAGFNVKIQKGKVKLHTDVSNLRRVLEDKTKLQAERYRAKFLPIDFYVSEVLNPVI